MTSTDVPEQEKQQGRSRVGVALLALLRTRISTGVLTIIPILITLWVVRIIFSWMRSASEWVFELILFSAWGEQLLTQWGVMDQLAKIKRFEQDYGFTPQDVELIDILPMPMQWVIGTISVLFTIFILYAIGLFAANVFGRRIIQSVEHIVDRVPLVKTIYRLPKQVITTFTATQKENFRKAALVPFPQEKMRCVGFITNMFTDSVTGEELCSVFIPTTPNPTTGYLQVMRRAEITELNWTIEDAIRAIMSGLILKPHYLTIIPNKDLPDDVPPGVGQGPLPPPEEVHETNLPEKPPET